MKNDVAGVGFICVAGIRSDNFSVLFLPTSLSFLHKRTLPSHSVYYLSPSVGLPVGLSAGPSHSSVGLCFRSRCVIIAGLLVHC